MSAASRRASRGRTARLLGPLVRDAFDQLRAGWRGQALTLAGIVWGAAAVVLLLSLGAGFNGFLDVGFDKTGSHWVLADAQYTSTEAGGRRPGRRIELTLRDLARARAQVASARAVAGEWSESLPVRTPRRTRATVVSAGSPELLRIQNHAVARGRWFDADDDRAGRRVAVLGAELPRVFFGNADPLGRSVQIAGQPFRVIGVLERKGSQLVTMNEIHDRMLFVPLDPGLRALSDGETLHHLYLDLRRRDDEEAARAELRSALWPLHHLEPEEREAVSFMSIPRIAQPFRTILFALQVLLGIVGTMTLAMAGVGIANLMIAIAHERRMELAVRRTCGARRSDLLLQLLVETASVVLAGGALGVLLALGIVAALHAVPLPPDFPPPRPLPSVVVTTFLVLSAVGLVAGIWPARIAARVDPSAALRVT